MCTLVMLRRPEHDWPVLIGANRDEMIARPAKPPGRHWPDRPEIVAGLDVLAGGSWLGLNDWGVAAAVLNRHGSLGPAPGQRSRGELVLEALDHADAVAAVAALSDLDPAAYRTFNLIVADNRDAFWLRHAGTGRIEAHPVPEGLSLIAAGDLDDRETRRLVLARPRFAATPPPDPDHQQWESWQALLSSAEAPPGEPENAPLRFRLPDSGFATVSSALIGLPGTWRAERRPAFRFAQWLPEELPWHDVPPPA
ncbi:MAG: NRDE family protein [Alphaproteobacteria bacterium]|nr:NRDE family protein [Alphaproteobacteria bacterium]